MVKRSRVEGAFSPAGGTTGTAGMADVGSLLDRRIRPRDMTSPQVEHHADPTLAVAGMSRPARPAENRQMGVVLDSDLPDRLRAHAEANDLTLGQVVLQAVNDARNSLEHRWGSSGTPADAGLFEAQRDVRHRRERPGVQIQVRLSPRNIEILDDLARQWNAPSRSEMINVAVRIYLSDQPAGQQD